MDVMEKPRAARPPERTKPAQPGLAALLAELQALSVMLPVATRDEDEIEAAFDAGKRAEMLQKSGGAATYPQIFIGDRHVGGCDDLHDLEAQGRLDALLAG